MIDQNTATKFTALQQELLNLFGREVAKEDLIAIKDMIGKYFLEKLQNEVNIAVEKKEYNKQEFIQRLNNPQSDKKS